MIAKFVPLAVNTPIAQHSVPFATPANSKTAVTPLPQPAKLAPRANTFSTKQRTPQNMFPPATAKFAKK